MGFNRLGTSVDLQGWVSDTGMWGTVFLQVPGQAAGADTGWQLLPTAGGVWVQGAASAGSRRAASGPGTCSPGKQGHSDNGFNQGRG